MTCRSTASRYGQGSTPTFKGPKPVRAIGRSTALWLFGVSPGAVPPGGVSTSTVRPKRTRGEQAARDPACATLRGVGPGVGASARRALREGSGRAVLGDTTCSDPSAKKDKRVHLGAQRAHVKNTCTTATTPAGAHTVQHRTHNIVTRALCST